MTKCSNNFGGYCIGTHAGQLHTQIYNIFVLCLFLRIAFICLCRLYLVAGQCTLCFLFPLLSVAERYITVQSFSSSSQDELGFESGVIVEVIQRNLEGWWFIR